MAIDVYLCSTRKHSQNLHPNHYYLQDIKLALCQMIGQSAAGQGHEIFNLTEKELLYKQKIAVELLEVANKGLAITIDGLITLYTATAQ